MRKHCWGKNKACIYHISPWCFIKRPSFGNLEGSFRNALSDEE